MNGSFSPLLAPNRPFRFRPDGVFPKTLPLVEQGRFALGYYHQRDVFRRRKDVPAELEHAEAAADTQTGDDS